MRLLDDLQCAVRSGSVHISVLDGALWDAWQVRCGMGEIGLSLLLFNRSVQIVVWYLWCWDLFYVILVCIRFHVIFVSCDCIMKCIFVWTQVVNKLPLLLSFPRDILACLYDEWNDMNMYAWMQEKYSPSRTGTKFFSLLTTKMRSVDIMSEVLLPLLPFCLSYHIISYHIT